VSTNENNEDETDHRPDGRNMDQLRTEVRDELVKHGMGLDMNGAGIADEEGLGWPGEYIPPIPPHDPRLSLGSPPDPFS
jgi:hypothetical protein